MNATRLRATGHRASRGGPRRLTALLLGLAGCNAPSRQDYEWQLRQLKQALEQRDQRLQAQQATIAELHAQLAAARGLPADWAGHIFYPVRLQIDRLSGGEDYDGNPGDDGVTVYLRPLDQAGDVVKVAGDVVIQLYDLANPPGRNLVGEYRFSADELGKAWHGRLMTYHFTLRCPWQHGPPAHRELTIRATFVDYLTKRVMSAQRTCRVRLAG